MWAKNFKNVLFILFAVLLSMALWSCSQKKDLELPPGIELGEEVSFTASVEAIDYKDRHVTLKGPKGNMVSLYVPEDAYNFKNVDVGDIVEVLYTQSMAISVEKAGEGPSATAGGGAVRAPEGQKPEAATYSVVELRATVDNIDYETRLVDLRGPQGNITTIEVDDDVENFKNVKKGDEVVVKYIEAMAITVRPSEN
ncbi:MAG: hypothetical protein HF978_14925 [Desulfobacteraceae bacterium]|nr:hypothetical protein [Desulfobacteraceae bacterium]MBC2756833.1 hypothetical protein [Desulfobacteraceae bacterium]